MALIEVVLFLQDRGALAFSLLLPVVVFALMYGAFGERSAFHGSAQIVNNDPGGEYSRLLLEHLRQSGNLDVVIHSPTDADRKLENSDLQLVLFIPADFSRNLTSGRKTSLVMKQRGNGGQEGQIVASMIRGEARRIGRDIEVVRQVQESVAEGGMAKAETAAVVQKFLDRERRNPTVQVVETALGGRPDPARQFFPGIVTMFILFSITLTARTVVEEKKRGTLERLLTTRLTPGQLFTGKFLSGIFKGFIQTFILSVLGYLVFRFFTPLTFLEVLLVALVFAATASALGLVIAVLAPTEASATWVAVFFTMAMTMLGGTFFTVGQGTVWETLSRFSVNTYANHAMKTVMGGGGLSDMGWQLSALAAVAVAALLAGRLLFRVEPGGR